MITPAVACGTNTDSSPSPSAACSATNRRHAPLRSAKPRSDPVRTWSFTECMAERSGRVRDRLYGKIERSASRSRPSPPLAGADS